MAASSSFFHYPTKSRTQKKRDTRNRIRAILNNISYGKKNEHLFTNCVSVCATYIFFFLSYFPQPKYTVQHIILLFYSYLISICDVLLLQDDDDNDAFGLNENISSFHLPHPPHQPAITDKINNILYFFILEEKCNFIFLYISARAKKKKNENKSTYIIWFWNKHRYIVISDTDMVRTCFFPLPKPRRSPIALFVMMLCAHDKMNFSFSKKMSERDKQIRFISMYWTNLIITTGKCEFLLL